MSAAVYSMLGFTVASFSCLVLFTFNGRAWLSTASLIFVGCALVLLLGLTSVAVVSSVMSKIQEMKQPPVELPPEPLMIDINPEHYNRLDKLAKDSFDGNISAAAEYVLYSLSGEVQGRYLEDISAVQAAIMLESLSRRTDLDTPAKNGKLTAANIKILRNMNIGEEDVLSASVNPYKKDFIKALRRFTVTLAVITVLVLIGSAIHMSYGAACIISLIMAAPMTFSLVVLFLAGMDLYRFKRVKWWIEEINKQKLRIPELCMKTDKK